MPPRLASLIFENEVDEDRASAASRGLRTLIEAMADPEYERGLDEVFQAFTVKQVPGPISFTSAEEPCRTAILKAFQNICLTFLGAF